MCVFSFFFIYDKMIKVTWPRSSVAAHHQKQVAKVL